MLIEPFLQENNHFPGEKKPRTLGTQQLHTNRKNVLEDGQVIIGQKLLRKHSHIQNSSDLLFSVLHNSPDIVFLFTAFPGIFNIGKQIVMSH